MKEYLLPMLVNGSFYLYHDTTLVNGVPTGGVTSHDVTRAPDTPDPYATIGINTANIDGFESYDERKVRTILHEYAHAGLRRRDFPADGFGTAGEWAGAEGAYCSSGGNQ
jgi:hypothetical protein